MKAENGGKMTDNTLVTIIIPVYQVEAYLEQCITSILSQTYTNLEIILIDDGSVDRSGEICDSFAASDKRIRVFHSENRGLSAARNLGLEYANGEWIGFVDGDDWTDPEMIEKMLMAAQRTEADVCVCSYYQYDRSGEYKSPSVTDERILTGEAEKIEAFLKDDIIRPYVWEKLCRKALFQGIHFPEGRNYEDTIVTIQILMKAKRVVCIPDRLYYYRIRPGSIVHTHTLKNECDRWRSYRESYSGLMKKYPQYHSQIISKFIYAGFRVWCSISGSPISEQEKYADITEEVTAFAQEHSMEVLRGDYRFRDKVKIILVGSGNPILMKIFSRLLHSEL